MSTERNSLFPNYFTVEEAGVFRHLRIEGNRLAGRWCWVMVATWGFLDVSPLEMFWHWSNSWLGQIWKPSFRTAVFPDGSGGKESACNAGDTGSLPRLGWSPWQPTPVFFPGESHGQRSLAGYCPWSCKESDTTEWLSHHFAFWMGREGCSCCYVFTVNTFPTSPSPLGCGLLSFKPCLWASYDSI